MSEIDKFCMFVNITNGLCRSPINTNDKYCDEIPIERCYYKQLQQLKAENEELKRLIAKQKNAKIQLGKLNEKFGKDYCNIKQCLVEIEEIVSKGVKIHDDIIVNKQIIQLIKQAKEGEL